MADRDKAVRLLVERSQGSGLTYQDIAARCGYSVSTVRRIARAMRGGPQDREASGLPDAVRERDWPRARYELALILSDALACTKSGRDQKAIAHELVPLMDRCEADEAAQSAESAETPHARIMREAGRVAGG